MAAKIGVEELRARLHLRGLDSSGTKRILERRLDEALRKEGVESVMGKRERSSEEDFPAARVDDADAIRKMGIRELREQAALRGLSTAGAKVRLFERISAQLENDRRDLENADTSTGTEEKLVTATKKGGAVLDPYLPENVKASYHVFQRVCCHPFPSHFA
ncbi:poly [ADP-ribose] polymerase 2-like [Wolffia australiana]